MLSSDQKPMTPAPAAPKYQKVPLVYICLWRKWYACNRFICLGLKIISAFLRYLIPISVFLQKYKWIFPQHMPYSPRQPGWGTWSVDEMIPPSLDDERSIAFQSCKVVAVTITGERFTWSLMEVFSPVAMRQLLLFTPGSWSAQCQPDGGSSLTKAAPKWWVPPLEDLMGCGISSLKSGAVSYRCAKFIVSWIEHWALTPAWKKQIK